MSAQTYEALTAVPPLEQQKARWGWLLDLRRAARRALDAALSVPRKIAGWIGQLVHTAHVDGALAAVRRAAARLVRPAMWLLNRLGGTGIAAGVVSAVTSPTGQRVIGTVLGWVGWAAGWVARKFYALLDSGLRCFGRPGNKAADALFGVVVATGGRMAAVAAPVVHRVASLTDPQTALVRLVSSLTRGYALHCVMKAMIVNPYLRALVEGVVLPLVADSRLGQWAARQVRILRERALNLRDQASQPA